MSFKRWKLEAEDPRELYRELRALLRVKPRDQQPPETQLGPNMDLNFCVFLQCIHKYAALRNFRVRAALEADIDDVVLTITGRTDREVVSGVPRDHTFPLSLKTAFRHGVYYQQVIAFRELFNFPDDGKFFQIMVDGQF